MKQYYNLKLIATLILSLGLSQLWAQDITTIDYSGDYTTYTVPDGVSSISITAKGAQGAAAQSGRSGGKGASMYGEFDVEPGSTLIIAVGGEGLGASSGSNGGGGGGTFVVLDEGIGGPGAYTMTAGPFADHTVTPLIVAGGGGGTRSGAATDGNPGVVGEMGTSGSGGSSSGGGAAVTPAEEGALISSSSWGSAGGGFRTDGANDGSYGCGGKSFLNGALGGNCGSCSHVATGGFGGGGQGRGCSGGGGGGGWSGGQGGYIAGGGGSFNDGINQVNVGGENEGDGVVIIEVLCIGLVPDIPVTGVCLGEELTLDVDSETGGVITWSGGVVDGSPFSPPPGTTTYTATSSSALDCAFEIDISASPVPDITANSSLPTACEGALITLWGEGGDTYEWSGTGDVTPIDSVAFLAEEGTVTYTVVGSVLGCEGAPASITLVGAPQPEVIATATPSEICLGDSYTINGSGDGATAFDWGGGLEDGETITPESPGTFVHMVVGVSDEGCYDTAFATVIVHEIPIVNAGLDVTQCEGYDVILTATGAETYTWSPEITNGVPFPALPGENVYTVSGTNEIGCKASDMVTVTGVELPEITAVVNDEYSPYGGSIDITMVGGSGSFGYEWSHGPTTEDVSGLTAGSYHVNVHDTGVDIEVCPDVDSLFFIRSYVGVEELGQENLSIYPNPTTNSFVLSVEGEYSYKLFTINGKEIISGIGNDQVEIDLTKLSAGTYLIEVSQGENIYNAKVVKE